MVSRYKLLPVQVENLKNQYNESLARLLSLNVIKKAEFEDLKAATGEEMNTGLDSSLLSSLSVASTTFKESRNKLADYELIIPSNSDIIELGSTFAATIKYDDGDLNMQLTLVEEKNVGDSNDLVSISSPIGSAVLGKQAGDAFRYRVGQRTITGKVNNIIKEQEKTL